MLNLLRDRKPDYLAAAFDGGGPVFRSEIFADYKANRAAMPDDLVPQIPVIRRVFEGFRVPVLMHAGMRGRRRDRHPGPPRRGARARRRHLHRRQGRPPAPRRPHPDPQPAQATGSRRRRASKADWGVRPDQVVDFLALTGDTSTTSPASPGIGLKTGVQAARGVRRPREPAGQRRQGLGRQAARRTSASTPRPPGGPGRWSCSGTTCRSSSTGTRCGPTARRQGAQGALHRVRLPPLPDRARPEPSPTPPRPPWDSRLSHRRHARALRGFVAELRAAAQVLRRHRDDRRSTRSAPTSSASRSRWKEGEAYYLPGPRARSASRVLDRDGDARRAPARPDRPAVEKVGQNLKYDMLVLGRAGSRSAGRSPTRWS